MQTAPKEISAVSIDITGISALRPVNTLNQIYQLQKWQEMKTKTADEIAKVDEVLDSISQEPGCGRYKDILFMWYVEKLDKEDIAQKLGYSSRQSVYDLRNRAIKKFSIALFGIVALKAM